MKQTHSFLTLIATATVLAISYTASAQTSIWAGGTHPTDPSVWTATAPTNWVFNNGTAAGIPNAINNSTPNADAILTSAATNKNITLSQFTYIKEMFLYGGNYSLDTSGGSFYSSAGLTNFGSSSFDWNGNNTKVGAFRLAGTGTGTINLNGALEGSAISIPATGSTAPVYTATAQTFLNIFEGAVNLKNTYSNTTTLTFGGGVTTFSGAGAFVNQTGAITIGGQNLTPGGFGGGGLNARHDSSNAALVLDFTGTNSVNRIVDTSAITLSQRSLLELKGHADGTTESLGALSFNGSSGARIRVNTATGSANTAQLTFASLGSSNGILQFLSNDTFGDKSKVIFTNTANTNNQGILKGGIVKDASTTLGSYVAATFATYDATNGVKGLAAGDYTTTDIDNAALVNNTAEVNLTGSSSISATRVVNALRINASGAGQSLDLGANNLSFGNAAGFIFNGGTDGSNVGNNYSITGTTGAALINGFTPAAFYINSNTLTIDAAVNRSAALSKAGEGLLVVAGAYSNLSADALHVDKGVAVSPALAQTAAATYDDMRISGEVKGATTFGLSKTGAGQLALTGAADNSPNWTSGTTVTHGTLVLAKDSAELQSKALGTGTLLMLGGTLAARGFDAELATTIQFNHGVPYSEFAGDKNITFTGLATAGTNSSQGYGFHNNNSATVTFAGRFNFYSSARAGIGGTSWVFGGSGETVIKAGLVNGGLNADGTKFDPLSPTNQNFIMVKEGAGTLALAPQVFGSFNGVNDGTGNILVKAGYLRLENTGALSVNSNLNLGEQQQSYGLNAVLELGSASAPYGTTFARNLGSGSTVGAAQIQLTGNSAGFASYNGTSTVSLGSTAGVANAPLTWGSGSFLNDGAVFTLGSEAAGSAGTLDFTNAIALGAAGKVRTIRALNGAAAVDGVLSGALSGAAKLIKDGAGTLSLTGPNGLTGEIVISAGTLLANSSSATGTGTVSVNIGATLGGNGTVGGGVTVNSGGSIAPGSGGIGTLNVGTITLSGSYAFEANGATKDLLVVTGDLNLSGATLALSGTANQPSYVIASYTGTRTGTFGGSPPSGYAFEYDDVAKEVRLVSGGAPASYATYAASFSPALSGADVDEDNDGLKNGIEYVLGTNPRAGNQGGPTGTVVGTNLIFTFNRVDSSETSDSTLHVQTSTDLVTWVNSYRIGSETGVLPTSAGVAIAEGSGADPDVITVTIPKGADPKKFARLSNVIAP
ncbi:MAG: autotransporter-associated beta strand repeat-containing protein [Akkermansiaceae bacterium]|nr:autotransporter-associated beta strand repeat-containing protein [Verrucomicrobiales bacterium]